MVLRQGLSMVLVGVVVGLVGALAATRMLGSLLFEVSERDPITFVAVPIVLTITAVAAALAPALRAARVDPVMAFRSE